MRYVHIVTPLGYLSIYLLAVGVGRLVVLDGTGLALFWPAAGVAAIWLLRGTTTREVMLDTGLLFTSTTVLYIGLDKGLVASLLFGTANTVQGFVVRGVRAHRARLPISAPQARVPHRPGDLLELILVSVLASTLSAPFGVTALWLSSDQESWTTAAGWITRNSCGGFVVMAVVLTVVSAARSGLRRSHVPAGHPSAAAIELVVLTAVTVAAALLIFTTPEQRPIAFVMIATTVWIGSRFPPVIGVVHSVAVGTVAIWCTVLEEGPFGILDDPVQRAISVQVFVAISTTIVLMLSFGTAERVALIRQLRASEAEARKHADLVEAVTTTMTDGVVVVDTAGMVLLQNPAAERIMGRRRNGRRAGIPARHGLHRLDGSPTLEEELPSVRALQGEFVAPYDLLRIDPGTGHRTILSMTALPMRRTSDAPAVAVLVVRDVTKARARRRELENFAGVVAHDLKNPLTAVQSWAEILEEQLGDAPIPVGDPVHASLRRIRGSAERMGSLIADLLAYSQTQSAELFAQSVSLDDLVDQIAADLRATHRMEVPVVEHAPLGRVHADLTLVRQLLTNLMGNAVKYVAPGVVPHLVLGAAPVEGMLEVWLSDNGVGIADQELGKVFDSFYRAPSTLDYPGTGLGLAICANTVERHGGQISARQGLGGEGTTITFTLPLGPEPPVPTGVRPLLEPLSAV